ncbi:hypothetical protein SAMN00790413_02392 [Deinococcus hopiensis KR-140]|uniref:Uncharacterized protein n=1 Tax=Deinococcus hopiensis KR-140 TaxID=695939 RepID=A0A1W1VMK6_9DEIO|nr:hypothetical protein SAMN00790413_02392 [Deinococcus hopiensis KR-140]
MARRVEGQGHPSRRHSPPCAFRFARRARSKRSPHVDPCPERTQAAWTDLTPLSRHQGPFVRRELLRRLRSGRSCLSVGERAEWAPTGPAACAGAKRPRVVACPQKNLTRAAGKQPGLALLLSGQLQRQAVARVLRPPPQPTNLSAAPSEILHTAVARNGVAPLGSSRRARSPRPARGSRSASGWRSGRSCSAIAAREEAGAEAREVARRLHPVPERAPVLAVMREVLLGRPIRSVALGRLLLALEASGGTAA